MNYPFATSGLLEFNQGNEDSEKIWEYRSLDKAESDLLEKQVGSLELKIGKDAKCVGSVLIDAGREVREAFRHTRQQLLQELNSNTLFGLARTYGIMKFLNGTSEPQPSSMARGAEELYHFMRPSIGASPFEVCGPENTRVEKFLNGATIGNPVPRPSVPCSIVDALRFVIKDRKASVTSLRKVFDQFLLAVPPPGTELSLDDEIRQLELKRGGLEGSIQHFKRFRPTSGHPGAEPHESDLTKKELELSECVTRLIELNELKSFWSNYKPSLEVPESAKSHSEMLRELHFYPSAFVDTTYASLDEEPEDDGWGVRPAVFVNNELTLCWLIEAFPRFWNKYCKRLRNEGRFTTERAGQANQANGQKGVINRERKKWIGRTQDLLKHLDSKGSEYPADDQFEHLLKEFFQTRNDPRTWKKINEFFMTLWATKKQSSRRSVLEDILKKLKKGSLKETASKPYFLKSILQPCRELLLQHENQRRL